MNLTCLGIGCLTGVLLWFATDRIVLLIVGIVISLALAIGMANGIGSSNSE